MGAQDRSESQAEYEERQYPRGYERIGQEPTYAQAEHLLVMLILYEGAGTRSSLPLRRLVV
jgi:hypothetical protein